MPTEYYRKQAKALLNSAQSGDSVSLERLKRHSPRLNPAAPKLHDSQLTIALEQAFQAGPASVCLFSQSGLDDRVQPPRLLTLRFPTCGGPKGCSPRIPKSPVRVLREHRAGGLAPRSAP
jgi:hypothetical protein